MKTIEDEMNTFIKVWLSAAASLCYCYFISSKIPKGIYRLLSLLPIFSLFTILPYSLSYMSTVTMITLFSWLATFKLILFSFNMGPLSTHPISGGPLNSFLLFFAIAALPVKIDRRKKFIFKPKKFPLSLPVKTFLLTVLLSLLADHREFLDSKILVVLYFWVLYLIVDTSIGWCTEIGYVWGLDLVPPSDEPYLATSLQDFWGRRWNLLVTNLLKDSVYNPVRWAAASVFGGEVAKAVAVLATFTASGLMHELLLYNLAKQRPSWEMTWHFLVHGVFVVVELGVKKVAGDRWRLPRWLLTAYTMGFVMVASYFLLFQAVVKTRVDVMMFEEFRRCMDFMKNKILDWVPLYGL